MSLTHAPSVVMLCAPGTGLRNRQADVEARASAVSVLLGDMCCAEVMPSARARYLQRAMVKFRSV